MHDYSGYKWIKVKEYKNDESLPVDERLARFMAHHIEETIFLIEKVRELGDRINTLEAAIEKVVTQEGDDLCWRDIYTELAGLIGIDFVPKLICDPDHMAANCKAFDKSLREGGEYIPIYTEKKPE